MSHSWGVEFRYQRPCSLILRYPALLLGSSWPTQVPNAPSPLDPFSGGEESLILVYSPICVWVSTTFFSATWQPPRLLRKPSTANGPIWTLYILVNPTEKHDEVQKASPWNGKARRHHNCIPDFWTITYKCVCQCIWISHWIKQQENRWTLRAINDTEELIT